MKARRTDTRDGIDLPPRGLPYGPGIVSKDNFAEKAVAFMRASGRANGDHPVVRKDGNLEAWVSWIAYLDRIGYPCKFAKSQGVLTVPAEYPWDFTADADDLHDEARRLAEEARHVEPTISPERRRELAQILRGILPRPEHRRRRGADGRDRERPALQPWQPGDPVPSLSSEALGR